MVTNTKAFSSLDGQRPKRFVVSLSGSCCPDDEQQRQSPGTSQKAERAAECERFNGDFVVTQDPQDPDHYTYDFPAGMSYDAQTLELRFNSDSNQPSGYIQVCVFITFGPGPDQQSVRPVAWGKVADSVVEIGVLRRRGTNTLCCWPQCITVAPAPVRETGPASCMNTSCGPVRYFNGEVSLEATDVASSGFGTPWSHTRTYSNQQEVDFDRGNGWNWNPVDWPYLAQSNLTGSSLTLYGNLYNLRYFDANLAVPGTFTPQFGDLSTLVHLSVSDQLQLTEPDGTVVLFHDLSHSDRPGGFVSMTSPGETLLEVTQETGDRIVEIQRSFTSGGVTATESFIYDYVPSGDLEGHILSCTVRKRPSATDPWEDVTRVLYSYYEEEDPFGGLADLRTATRQVWGSSAWIDTATDYYRYYKEGDSLGNPHGLKFVCGPDAFDRLSAAVSDPFTATDGEVSLFADYYYEYDENNRVVLERIYAGSKTILFSFERNPNFPVHGSLEPNTDYNAWVFKTTETQPDDSRRISFANFAGQTMLSVRENASGTERWCTFILYDERGQPVWTAQPSAVIGYDQQYDDLLHFLPSEEKYEFLRDSDGLIRVVEYYEDEESSSSSSSSSHSGAEPDGYLKAELIQRGQLSTPILVRSVEYTSHTAGDVTIFPVSQEIEYPDDSNPSEQIITGYDYTFHSGTTQIAEQTTILPVISTSQNGSGTANSRKEFFDALGYRTWSMDERGFITRSIFNNLNGALAQRIEDVDTSVVSGAPSGWTTPTGGGLNLVTDFESDDQGRNTQVLGPSHAVDIGGVATTIRQATWTVYDDALHAVRTAQGYATGTAPSYTYTLINPVQIRQMDSSQKLIAEISATRGSSAGKLLPSDTFAQSSYVRWTTYQYTDCCLLASQRVYHTIPASGEGVSGTNYDETAYGYDVNKRRNREVTPGGTITFSVLDSRGLTAQVFVGTDDTGATPSDPTGGSASGNNMVLITGNEYDDGESGGDGNLTQVTQWVDDTTSRVTDGGYDWRNRLIWVDGEIDFFATATYDNLDRMTRVDRYDTTSTGNLIARRETKFDDLGRVYQSVRFGVDPTTGSLGNSLTDNTWYDPAGNTVKTLMAGSDLWMKTAFDSLGREVAIYVGYGTEAMYSDIFSVTGNVVLSQTEIAYDDGGNPIQTTQRERYHDAPAAQTGALGSPSATPNARVTYAADYPDPIGRPQANANYGTNGGAAFTRSATIPTRSDVVLVQSQTYDEAGNLWDLIDAAGVITRFAYDDTGRRQQVVENYQPSSPSSSSSSSGTDCGPSADANITTNLTYTPDGLVKTLEAINSSTGNQLTDYVYGTTLADSGVAASVLLRSVIYPDSTGSSDQVWIGYNRQAERADLTDQNGTLHQYDYDLLGRLTQDRVGTLGAGIDGAIRRIELAYEVRGLMSRVTSSDSPSSGNTVNEVMFTYNNFGQSINTYQAHAGAVDLMTTPSVQMGYANGSANTIRPTSLTYPNGRQLSYNYGMNGSIDSSASRVASLIDSDGGSTHLADYSYLGLGSVVEQTSPQADLLFTLANITSGNDPDTGDIYTGLDRFGRIKDVRWRNTDSNTDLSRIQYGYNRASNRTWRENPTDSNRNFDWKYGYDGAHRLKNGQRGTLNGTQTEITSPQFGQCWTLDETGNWERFKQANSGAAWTLEQSRTSNEVNEVTEIDNTVGTAWAEPAYDAAGNMTMVPKPADPTDSFAATYDAWNRLVKLTDGAEGPLVQENEYDGRGYRIVTKSYDDTETLLETRQAYFTEGWQVVEERLGESATPDRQFVWGVRYIDDLVLRDRSVDSGTLNERLYSLQDGNWNVTAVADATGTVQERYEFDPYGVASVLAPDFTIRGVSDFEWETTYCGYRWDATTGLFAVRNRYYHPVLGVWLTRDPIEYAAGDVNLMRYVGNGSVNRVDPIGHRKWRTTVVAKSFIADIEQFGGVGSDPFDIVFVEGQQGNLNVALGGHYISGLGIATPHIAMPYPSDWLRELGSYRLYNTKEDPTTDAKDGIYRLYSSLTLEFECCDGKLTISPEKQRLDIEGGYEALYFIYGTINADKFTYTKMGDSSMRFSYRTFGRPNPYVAEPTFWVIKSRTAHNIWHQVEVVIGCRGNQGYHAAQIVNASAFPSHRLWVNGGQSVSEMMQGALTDLWISDPHEPEFVTPRER